MTLLPQSVRDAEVRKVMAWDSKGSVYFILILQSVNPSVAQSVSAYTMRVPAQLLVESDIFLCIHSNEVFEMGYLTLQIINSKPLNK